MVKWTSWFEQPGICNHPARRQLPLQSYCWTNGFMCMVFLHVWIVIKVGALIMKLWPISMLCPKKNNQLLCYTIHMAMLHVIGWTVHLLACSNHYQNNRRPTGHYTYQCWYLHTMPCHIALPVTSLRSWCLGAKHQPFAMHGLEW